MGAHSAAAAAAAAAIASRVKGQPTSAISAARARSTVGATAPSAMRARFTSPPAISSEAATLTTAIAIASRKASLWKKLAAPGAGRGISTATISSPGASAVRPGPSMRSSTASVRRSVTQRAP
ncbi:hypothetical protein FJ251_08480 [bacterium]|nr:hypothetical protein [bacterium]